MFIFDAGFNVAGYLLNSSIYLEKPAFFTLRYVIVHGRIGLNELQANGAVI